MIAPDHIALQVDAGPMAASLASLAELAERSLKVRERLVGLLDSGDEIVRLENRFAAGAGKITFALNPSDGFLEAVAAIRAGEVPMSAWVGFEPAPPEAHKQAAA